MRKNQHARKNLRSCTIMSINTNNNLQKGAIKSCVVLRINLLNGNLLVHKSYLPRGPLHYNKPTPLASPI